MNIRTTLTAALLLILPLCTTAQSEISVVDDKTGKTEEIGLPEGMMSNELDSLLREWHTKTYTSFNEDCETNNENPTYTKEEYIARLSHLPNVIDMPYNEVVRKFIDQYSNRLRRSVAVMLGASNFYFPIFEEALETYQMPLELKYLPIIESALNPGATSRVGAAGLWQFMPATGKQYGLEITSLIDERRDPIKSSYAAARYLKDLYDIFGDWTLAIASYNCGPQNVLKAIKRADGSKDYWTIYPYLPAETRGYVPAFIAANYIMTYYCEHNICPVNTRLPAGTDTIMVNRDVRFEQIHELCNISIEELRALNPQYRTTLVPGDARPLAIRMPAETIGAFIEAGDSLYAHRASELFSKKEKEVVASSSTVSPNRGRQTSSRQSRGGKSITVRPGDTLGAIARRNHTSVSALKRLNGMRGTNIRAGQKLRVR
ncbi:MAG: transglycosylase SLT domain-containing protein [Bacteroidaceae bacterium]|nr:transglycosylase SLT domain-containing protein [Bacteroidaceae bacterium]